MALGPQDFDHLLGLLKPGYSFMGLNLQVCQALKVQNKKEGGQGQKDPEPG